jgi:hypothetical protein
MGRPYPSSSRAPQAFIDTSSSPASAPKRASVAISSARFLARPTRTSAAGSSTPATRSTRTAPNRSAIRPLRASVSTLPAGTANSARPRRPSLRWSDCLMAGSRALHAEKATPRMKK